WILIVATARVVRNEMTFTTTQILLSGGAVIVVLLVVSWLLQARADRRTEARELADAAALARPFDAMAGGYPVPPMPGQQAAMPTRRANSSITKQEAIDG
ncbi:MAG: hypothetical protein WC005_11150, partial [Candidatus Nanopelagicales bacterium]